MDSERGDLKRIRCFYRHYTKAHVLLISVACSDKGNTTGSQSENGLKVWIDQQLLNFRLGLIYSFVRYSRFIKSATTKTGHCFVKVIIPLQNLALTESL